MSQIQNISLYAASSSIRQDNIDGEVNHVIRILEKRKGNSDDLFFEDFPITVYPEAKIHEFRFDDSEDDNGITQEIAKQIADILVYAEENNENVVVHCILGKQRSGAVAQAACAFWETFSYKGNQITQNVEVKRKILSALGYYSQWE
jgi:protein tyrosine phosphatase